MKSYNYKSLFLIALATAFAFALPVGAQTVAITGGKVYPVSGPPIEGGTVVIVNGRITAVASMQPAKL
jgi:imidazolonepropionase-like amidohydrolase